MSGMDLILQAFARPIYSRRKRGQLLYQLITTFCNHTCIFAAAIMSSLGNVSGDKLALGGVLKRYLTLVDARQVTISTSEGAELMSETRGGVPSAEDSHTVMSLAPSFYTSMEQSTRLQLGAPKHSMTWAANSILLQTKVESLVVSILFEENANLGIAEEHLEELRSIIKPYCGFSES